MTAWPPSSGFPRFEPRRGPRPGSKEWWACQQPERPPDPYVVWHYEKPHGGCSGCRLKASVLLRQYPDDTHVQWLNDRLAAVGVEDKGTQ